MVAARGHLHPGEIVTALAPVTRAVADLHALGVVHADLSPGNILFTRQGRPMVSDLGVATLFGELPEVVHATEGFVAPEVMLGEPPTPASDVYSLGALAWLGLTGGAPPLPALRPPLADVVDGQPARLVQLVERCLAGDAGARPTAASVALDLFDAAPAEPVQGGDGSDPASSITHRIRASARLNPPPRRVGVRDRGLRRGWACGAAPGCRVPGWRARRRPAAAAWAAGPAPVDPCARRPPARGSPSCWRWCWAEAPGSGSITPGASTPAGDGGEPAAAPAPDRARPPPPARRPTSGPRSGPSCGPPRGRCCSASRTPVPGPTGPRDATLLDGADVAGSPSRARHEQLLRRAAAAGATYDGLRYVVREATRVAAARRRGDAAGPGGHVGAHGGGP